MSTPLPILLLLLHVTASVRRCRCCRPVLGRRRGRRSHMPQKYLDMNASSDSWDVVRASRRRGGSDRVLSNHSNGNDVSRRIVRGVGSRLARRSKCRVYRSMRSRINRGGNCNNRISSRSSVRSSRNRIRGNRKRISNGSELQP